MPLLWYKDPADGQFKPYPSGMAQADADDLYVAKSGDTMTGDLTIESVGDYSKLLVKNRYPRFNMDNDEGDAGYPEIGFLRGGLGRWLIRTANNTEPGADVGTDLQFLARADDGASLGVALTLNRKNREVVLSNGAVVDKPPYAKFYAAPRAIPLNTWTQFTSVAISDQDNGVFTGGSNMSVPLSGYYMVTMRVLTTVAGRIAISASNSGDNAHTLIPNLHADARHLVANDWIVGSRPMWIDSYIGFYVYATPAATCTLYAEVIRIGGS